MLWAISAQSDALAQGRVRYRTAPSARDAGQIARDYLRSEQLDRGVPPADLAQWRERGRHVGRRSGLTHLYLRQQLGGIEVWNGDVTLAIAPDGRLVNLRARFVAPDHARKRRRSPTWSAAKAVQAAAARAGLTPSGPLSVRSLRPGPARETVLAPAALSSEPITARLVYLEVSGGALHLVWNFDLRVPDGRHWWVFNVDAASGEVRTQLDRVRHAKYRVYALPLESPNDGPRTLEVNPADPNASPLGWHDLDGVAGADTQTSEGNNVSAAENASLAPPGLALADPNLVFDFPLDPNAPPSTYLDAAITNLFYWNNVLHDLHFHYGFDEASGNFQFVHYGSDPNGEPGDDLTALTQDRTNTNNASMATPVDGLRPTMRMHLFSNPVLSVTAPPSLQGHKEAGEANFGPSLTTAGVSGDLAATLPSNACSAITNPGAIVGRVALVDRGSCNFIDKVDNAETAGAVGVIVANNVDGASFTMGAPPPPNPTILIPSVLIRRAHGEGIRAALEAGTVSVHLLLSERDSDLDNGVIIHEFGHGVSTRLTGGSANASCLLSGQAAGMGEGWGDFWALAITADPNDVSDDPRSIGSYLVGEPGIRNFPYSTDLSVNPQTFSEISTTNAPHGVGEIWAQALWETYWVLVDALGFDADLYEGSGGNNVALRLVMEGLKLQPCAPDFIEARDALIAADMMNHASAHECRIWRGFAKRGLGASATASPVSEDFALPPACPLCGDADVNGLVDMNDEDLLRAELAVPGTLGVPGLDDCVARSFSGACDILEVALLRRGIAGLAPGLGGTCLAAPAP
jgi:hypothetical protein